MGLSKQAKITILGVLNFFLLLLVVGVVVISNSQDDQQKQLSVYIQQSPKENSVSTETKGIIKTSQKGPLTIKERITAKKYTPNKTQLNESIPPTSSNRKALGWIPFWDQERAFSSFQKNSAAFSHISLFWYLLRSDGSVKKYIYAVENKNIIKYAHSRNVKVLALVANLPDEDEGGDWDSSRVDKVIGNSTARKKHIAELVSLSKKHGFDGINIDYEAMKSYQKENFTLFIKELASTLHENGKILAVALHPKNSEENPEYSNGSQAQDWKELGKYADQLHVMTYGENWNTSSAGPIASIPWVKSILIYAGKLIPKEKLFAGIPLYGYDWSNTPKANGLTYQEVQKLIRKHNPKVLFDKNSQSKHFGYRDNNGVSHTVWFEDKDTIQAKLRLIDNLGLSKTAFWRLGGEDPRVWTTLRKFN